MLAGLCGTCAAEDCTRRRAEPMESAPVEAQALKSEMVPVVAVIRARPLPSASPAIASAIFELLEARNTPPSAVIGALAIILHYIAMRYGGSLESILAHVHMHMTQVAETSGMERLSQVINEAQKSELN